VIPDYCIVEITSNAIANTPYKTFTYLFVHKMR
jgi:hypothetical protein